ncbi:uncharacterized protein PITG_23043 [Phytophthora infestans T30-4]|uniref:Uncharacterized protein n=1 Tax=Phytophthora infestans (strain T30-4) TaxID=403677 RepID=D0NQC5_PHYIT|nr:uncharacterized protein PITG_23043 [Phytophthora infestans T30-4]EEY62857.1 conserved hypothetical protein [Phytophthora infestans T30-4]|eukprot:XP_002898732.1 conserved hypothetical protein [Phytophthora infestans T30-4]
MGRSWCQSLLLYYGLTSQVKALDTERKKQVTQPGIIIEAPSPSRPSAQAQVDEVLQVDIEDEESRLARDLLLDCEAAISALFASSGVDVNGEVDEMDSDLSGAEEEPIPPSPEGDTQQVTSCSESLDEVDAVKAKESPSTVLEELSTTVNPSEDSDKKPDTKKQRGSKFKAVVSQTIKKAEKPKKKKKRKGKPELRRTSTYATATPPSRPKTEDEPSFTSGLAADVDTNPKLVTKRTLSAARSKSLRPKTSNETPKSVSSAILQATKNIELRANSRLCPLLTHPTTSFVLPSVVDSSRVVPRIPRTAPVDVSSVLEDKTQSRTRSELPALQLSGRDEDQRRHSLRRRSRRQENDMKSDNPDTFPKTESYGSSKKLLNLVT